MKVELDKKDIIKLVNTVRAHEDEIKEFIHKGWILFEENRDGPIYSWNQAYLNSLEEEVLWGVYLRYKK